MLPKVATLMFTATPGELCLRIKDLTALEPTALRVTISDLVTEHGQVCLVKGVRRGTYLGMSLGRWSRVTFPMFACRLNRS